MVIFSVLIFIAVLNAPSSSRHLKYRALRNKYVSLGQGCITSTYCRPHYFYLYEVQPPMSSSYIYEIRSIKD